MLDTSQVYYNTMINDWLHSNFDVVKSSGDEYIVCCPFCDTDNKFHMYINATKPAVYCHKCGWSGNWYTLVKDVSGAESYTEIWRQLQSPTTVQDYQTVVDRLHQRNIEATQLVDMPEWYSPYQLDSTLPYHANIVLRYAQSRLSIQDIIHYNIGYCSDVNNPMALRLIIPVERGYYQARFVSNRTDRKYINPVFPIEDRLFNYKVLEWSEHCFICEGAISAIATGKTALATLGANGATKEQRRRLIKSQVKQFTLVVEPEQVAVRQAIDLGDYLVGYGKQVRVRQFTDGDPADGGMFTEYEYGLEWKCQQ